ncbi:MAG: acetylxylan esterase [Oceanipulchritudo sp.]
MKQLLPPLFACLLFVSSIAAAYTRVAEPTILVTPDKPDWIAEVGEPVRFTVTLFRDQQPMEDVPVRYRLGEEGRLSDPVEAVVGAGGLVIEAASLAQPGFLRCSVEAEVDGQAVSGAATVGFDPLKIEPTQVMPDDFDPFWEESLRELDRFPMKTEMTLLPERCTESVNVYHVSFQTWTPRRPGARIYGIYAEPKEPGNYPAMLRVPGAGVRPYPGEIEMAEKGIITLQIGIHGIPVTGDPEFYTRLRQGSLHYYPHFNLDNREAYFFRRVYLGCVRANDFLTSREKWNGKDLIVTGGSQGGQLSIATAGLDKRVTGLAVVHPGFCDVTGYLHGRIGGWPHIFRWKADGSRGHHTTKQKMEVSGYYDAVNFGRRLTVPGIYSLGFNDTICPPTSVFAAYNAIEAPKELLLALETAHNRTEAQNAALNDWILAQMGLTD